MRWTFITHHIISFRWKHVILLPCHLDLSVVLIYHSNAIVLYVNVLDLSIEKLIVKLVSYYVNMCLYCDLRLQ